MSSLLDGATDEQQRLGRQLKGAKAERMEAHTARSRQCEKELSAQLAEEQAQTRAATEALNEARAAELFEEPGD